MSRSNIVRYILMSIGLVIATIAVVILCNVHILNESENYIIRPEREVPTGTQAIIVLGAYVRPNGSLSPALRERLDVGLELYRKRVAPKILVTGDHGSQTYNEVQAMKDYLIGNDVPEQDVFMDHAGFDTYDSLYRARDVFGIKQAIVATQEFHLPRAVYIGRSLGMEIYGMDAGYPYPWWYRMVMREWLARVKAVLDVELLHPQPKFLGPPIDITGDGRATQD